MPSQLLLFAEPLLREGLSRLLEAPEAGYRVATKPEELGGRPQLVIWQPGSVATLASLNRELEKLRSRWQPAPLLLLLPQDQPHPTAQLLQLPVAGLLEAPEPQQLLDAIATLTAGGGPRRWPGPRPLRGDAGLGDRPSVSAQWAQTN